MEFLTLSKQEVEDLSHYRGILHPHILISIHGTNEKVKLPTSPYLRDTLELEFDDLTKPLDGYYLFDTDQARQILNFVERNCHRVNLIITHCHAGISRSAGVNGALSKILNNSDDKIFKTRVPNMHVYTTILDEYFLTKKYPEKYPHMWYLRERSMMNTLSPVIVRGSRIKAVSDEKTV